MRGKNIKRNSTLWASVLQEEEVLKFTVMNVDMGQRDVGRHVKGSYVHVQLQKQMKGNQVQEVGRMDADLILFLSYEFTL